MSHRTAAWYAKPFPTFVDAIALVRRHLWLASEGFLLSDAEPDIWKVPAALYHRLIGIINISRYRIYDGGGSDFWEVWKWLEGVRIVTMCVVPIAVPIRRRRTQGRVFQREAGLQLRGLSAALRASGGLSSSRFGGEGAGD